MAVFVGTSGWTYKHWGRTFYADRPRGTDLLEHYAGEFDTVEINATFYRLPRQEYVIGWRKRVPDGFRFAVKGSRFLTHIQRLNVDKDSVRVFFERARLLRDKCGPILWQLPPNFHADPERLDRFLRLVPRRFRHAVEFRHLSWYEHPDTIDLLRRHGAALVWLSSMAMPPETTLTADFVYLRFHGLEGGFAHDYTRAELRPWAQACANAAKRGIDVHAYFNNDSNTRAPGNAREFRAMVERLRGRHAASPRKASGRGAARRVAAATSSASGR